MDGWKTIEERGRREEGKEGTEGKKIGREKRGRVKWALPGVSGLCQL